MDRTRTRASKIKTTKIKRERVKKKNMSVILNSYYEPFEEGRYTKKRSDFEMFMAK